MTAYNRNHNRNDPVASVGADFNINMPAAYREFPRDSYLERLIKKSSTISKCYSIIIFCNIREESVEIENWLQLSKRNALILDNYCRLNIAIN